jgi:hypothetical protein
MCALTSKIGMGTPRSVRRAGADYFWPPRKIPRRAKGKVVVSIVPLIENSGS